MNGRLIAALKDGSATPAEHIYELRQATSQIWEIAEFLRETRSLPEVDQFITNLDPEPRAALDRALAAVAPGGALAAQLATARNLSWHYPRPNDRVLARALSAVADRVSELIAGRGLARTRAAYADEVAVQFFSPSGDLEPEEMRAFLTHTRETLTELIEFLAAAVGSYVARTGALRPAPPEDQ